MKLSIVIPCFNVAEYLPQCLESILDQGLKDADYEIIVINDGSTDNTLDIACRFSDTYPVIKVFDQENQGLGAVRNRGIDLAQGEYIYFLDSDDYLAENTLGAILNIVEHNELDVLTFKTRHVFDDSAITSNKLPTDNSSILKMVDGITYISKGKFRNEVWWYLINRQFLLDSGLRFIVGKWMEDTLFTTNLFCLANKITHVDADVHRYRIRPSSAMKNKSPGHYNKVIDDMAVAAICFDEIIKSVPENHILSNKCKSTLRTKQQALVFFLLVRYLKSDLPISYLRKILVDFKKYGAYPLHHFLGTDYHGPSYRLLTLIFNFKLIFYPFVKLFRIFYSR
ncbi:glycosyltransferase [Flagellimonas sediminis]|uniref:Glycosyltransferase n=1 Tax=Flagellimonas sediminis TaxID=2696468 RepID=A0A6I5KP29_9FLAO|nr:glycosyltransferase [Allomuricauda sediminis]NDV42634.1 glycosyltransferase [Allomuricauda sediminis]